MADILLGVIIGLFIGWHVPQPVWIKNWSGWLVAKVKNQIKRDAKEDLKDEEVK